MGHAQQGTANEGVYRKNFDNKKDTKLETFIQYPK